MRNVWLRNALATHRAGRKPDGGELSQLRSVGHRDNSNTQARWRQHLEILGLGSQPGAVLGGSMINVIGESGYDEAKRLAAPIHFVGISLVVAIAANVIVFALFRGSPLVWVVVPFN